jgi:hypothetical protein
VIDYRPNLPPVFDQGRRGSCVACATAWTPKAFAEINEGDFPASGLSAAFLYSMCKSLDDDPNSEGTFPRIAMQVLQKYGVCPESNMPYSSLTSLAAPKVPSVSVTAKTAAEKFKISTYAQLCDPNDKDRSNLIATMRQALLREGPFVMALLVCNNFIPDADGRLPLPGGFVRGGHMVGIAGDMPSEGAFILRNTWGDDWGQDGYALFPYEWLFHKNDLYGWIVFEAWTQTDIVVPKAANRIEITPDALSMLVDGVEVALDQPAFISVQNRMLLPLRAVAGNLGYVVTWVGGKAVLTKPS